MADAAPYVMLVDDDPSLALFLGHRLREDGFEFDAAPDGRTALAKLKDRWPDVVLLDLMLPGMGGAEVAHLIKQRADIPVIVLSAIQTGEYKVEMITRYAEDYITKPFQYPELQARIRRVLRRVGHRQPVPELILGPDLTLLLGRRTAQVAGRDVRLSFVETRLLGVLAGRLGETVPTAEVITSVWSDLDETYKGVAWVTVRRLRQKIELDPDRPKYLMTDPHGGYRLMSRVDVVH